MPPVRFGAMRLRRSAVAITVAGGVAAVGLLVGLAANVASSQQRWPGPLELVHQHAWLTFFIAAGVAVLLAGIAAAVAEPTPVPVSPVPDDGAAAPASSAGRLPRDAGAFVGRDAEMAMIVTAVDAALSAGSV